MGDRSWTVGGVHVLRWLPLGLVCWLLVMTLQSAEAPLGARTLGNLFAAVALLNAARSESNPRPWVVLGLGALFVVAAGVAGLAMGLAYSDDGAMGPVSLLNLAGYGLGAAGLWCLRPTNLASVIDGLVVALAGLATGTAVALFPLLRDLDGDPFSQVSVALVAFAIVMRLAAGARLVTDQRPIPPLGRVLIASLTLDFLGNVFWRINLSGPHAWLVAGSFLVAGFLLALVGWSPDRMSLARGNRERRSWITRMRAVLLACAAVVPLVAYWSQRTERLSWMLLAIGLLAFGLVVVRLVLVTEELEAHRNQLDHVAHHDSVTGLPNRAMFERQLNALRRVDDPQPVAVLYVDLDDFKDVNDRYGHEVGDQVLAEAGARLSASVRGRDMVARVGGDEFAVLVTGGRIEDVAGRVAVRIQHRLAPPFVPPGLDDAEAVSLMASIGVAAPVDDLGPALRAADNAMYRAKRAGKGRIARAGASDFPDPPDDELTPAEVAVAIESGRTSVAYQPVVELGSGRVVGAEALLRWTSPSAVGVATADVVARAEASGAMVELGRWVLAQAAATAGEWERTLGERAPWVSVNLSRLEAAQENLHQEVTAVLAECALSPRRLVLEVKADALAELGRSGVARVRWLRSAGVRVAADDFGVGSQPLTTLGSDLVDLVKLDRAYVTAALEDDAVLADLVERAGNLGAVTLAEGIEDAKELAVVRHLGAALGQGYYFAPPLSDVQFLELLEAQVSQPLEGLSAWGSGGAFHRPRAVPR